MQFEGVRMKSTLERGNYIEINNDKSVFLHATCSREKFTYKYHIIHVS